MFMYLLFVFMIAIYYYGTRNFKHWEKKGVKFEKPLFLVGGCLYPLLRKVSLSEYFASLYRLYPEEKVVGFFEANNPALLIRDSEIIKHVLSTDFRKFHKRGINVHDTVIEPLMKNLFTVDGDVWKLMRQKLSPAFSSGKLKAMFPLIIERTEKLAKIASDYAETNNEVDVRELMARYTTDFIGACGFGLDSVALDIENSDFRKLGKRIFTITTRDKLVTISKRVGPEMFKNVNYFASEIEFKTVSIIKQIMEERDHKPSGRNDFIDMMLELKQKGKIIGESIEKRNIDGTPQIVEMELDDLLLAAQVFIFFAAGFETSSSATSFLLHKLAFHPEAQDKCQIEIDEVLNKYEGKLCYDAVKEMNYLEMAFRESIRCMPSPGFLLRKSSEKYTIPGTDITLDENTPIVISIEALGSDEKNFENPEAFIPERFHPDNIDKIKKFTYIPFGEGPRSCIGERLGIMQSMAGVAIILKNFTVSPSSNTLEKPLVDPNSLLTQNIIGGLPLTLTRRIR